MTTKKRLGVMGGTFDPIHIGHLVTAQTVAEAFSLERVIFMPAAKPPHKTEQKVTPPLVRLGMVRAAVADNPRFAVSDIEFCREGLSYTVDTIDELKRVYGDEMELFFIVGADSANDLQKWHNPDELLTKCNFVAASRGGMEWDTSALQNRFGQLAAKVHFLATPALDISSTNIRDRVRRGLDVRYFVTETVRLFIEREGLYRD